MEAQSTKDLKEIEVAKSSLDGNCNLTNLNINEQ